MPLSHLIFDFKSKELDKYRVQKQSIGAIYNDDDPMVYNYIDTAANFIGTVTDPQVDGNFYKYLSQEVPETCIVYREPHFLERAICRSVVDDRFRTQHRLLDGYFAKSLRPDPFNAHDYWERALHRFKYQVYVSKVSDKLLYHKMLKTADDLEEEDLCGDCHSSIASSYGGDNEPKRKFTFEMAKQGAIYAYVYASNLFRKAPTRLSVLFRLLMKRYLENDKIRYKWEKIQRFPCERKLSHKNDMRRLATGYTKRWYFYPMEWDMYEFIKSLIVIRTGVLGNKDQPICHTPLPSDNEEEIRYFIKNHFPLHRNRRRKTIKRIPDELGKRNFRRLIDIRKSFKDSQKVITRTERKEAIELRHKINLYMLTPEEKEFLGKLRLLHRFFLKRRYKCHKRKQADRIEWRITPIYSIKKNSPFTHDEIVIMCVGTGHIHYIGKLTKKEILLLTETAEEFHNNGLLNIDKDKIYILANVIPLIKTITTLNIGLKMRILNSKKYGKAFRNKIEYLFHHSNIALRKAVLLDNNVDITCERCRCYVKKPLVKGDYKCDPYTFVHNLSDPLTKVEQLAKMAVRLTALKHRAMRQFTFKMWEYKKLGRSFFRFVPTRDLAKLKAIPRALLHNTKNTPYGIPHAIPMSLYRLFQCTIAEKGIGEQCDHRLRDSDDLSLILRSLEKYTKLSSGTFRRRLCAQIVNKSISYMVKYRTTFHKITKLDQSVKEQRKLRLRGRRLKGIYTLLAQIVNWKVEGILANHPQLQQELMDYKEIESNTKSISSSTQTMSEDEEETDDLQTSTEGINSLMCYRNSIENLSQNGDDFQTTEEGIVGRYNTLISELKDIQQLTRPKSFSKQIRNKKRDCYLVIRSMYTNLKMGKINSHRIAKSINVWLRFDAQIRNLMDDFNDYIVRVIDFRLKNWPPKEEDNRHNLFEFEKPKTAPRPIEKLNECTYNKKLRVLINNKNKKILGGYRSLKLGTDWTSKYHEIIQRKFIKVEQFQQQKDSYVIQAGKMAAKGCEKVVKKCLYALSLFGFQKKDLELALLIYAKLRIMVKTEPKVRYPCKDKLLEERGFLNTKYQIYTEIIEQHLENTSKFNSQYISWRRLDNNFMNKVMVEYCGNHKLGIEKYFYGLDLRQTKTRKSLNENELFDLHDYKYYDYKSDDDFSNKLDYSSDSCYENKINVADCCVCEDKVEYHLDTDNNVDCKINTGRRISNTIDMKELVSTDSNNLKSDIISVIRHHHMSLRKSQSNFTDESDTESYPDLYKNSNNFHKHSRKFVLRNLNHHRQDKYSYKIDVSSDNDSSSTSFDTKFKKSYFRDKDNMVKRIPAIMESDMRIQSRRKEKKQKFALRVKLGGELCWRKTPKKLKDTFERFLSYKLSYLVFSCRDFRRHVAPEYHSIYYLRNLPLLIRQHKDKPLLFTSIANFRSRIFERDDRDRVRFDLNIRRGTEDMFSYYMDPDQSLSSSQSGSDKSKEKLKTTSIFHYENSFLSKYNDTYHNLKGYDFLRLKEETRNEIEHFKQLLRYEKECLVQNAHSNDILMEIAVRAEEGHTEESLLSQRSFIHKIRPNYKFGVYNFDPKEWQENFDWIKNNVSFGEHVRKIKK
ncbi:unnamed protein product [Nezara viridula]|uniref:Uncharacterized protein n=1 Tax=Nezara viridula TaxID=85310 RepID=A0A9P0H469_NEZVI|nr:unnamed protein product [Nezara viridula]